MIKSIKSIHKSRVAILFGMFMTILFIVSEPAFATATEPKIVSGSKELAAAAGAWLTGLIPATGAVLLGYHAWMKQMADNESGEIAARNKAMKRVVIFSAVAMTASGLFTLVMTYYK